MISGPLSQRQVTDSKQYSVFDALASARSFQVFSKRNALMVKLLVMCLMFCE